MAAIKTTTKGDRIFITGRTYEVRSELKAIGAKWNPAEKAWTVATGTDITPVLQGYQAYLERWAKEAEMIRMTNPGRGRRFYGACCAKAVCFTEEGRFDGPLHYKCEVHGMTYNSFCGD